MDNGKAAVGPAHRVCCHKGQACSAQSSKSVRDPSTPHHGEAPGLVSDGQTEAKLRLTSVELQFETGCEAGKPAESGPVENSPGELQSEPAGLANHDRTSKLTNLPNGHPPALSGDTVGEAKHVVDA